MNVIVRSNCSNDPTRIADRQGISGDVSGDNRTGTNHAASANCDATNDNNVAGKPTIAFNCDRFGVLVIVFRSV